MERLSTPIVHILVYAPDSNPFFKINCYLRTGFLKRDKSCCRQKLSFKPLETLWNLRKFCYLNYDKVLKIYLEKSMLCISIF